ncbi:multiple epidermal growth factor-like domains protein 10 isoform X1 [Haliotis rubra]|uniref:multiple epidermal growth factor-like domains protein 10 isoform X1 n=1 Tax=Haliotis rubra TaxID=36100 RepID=UPI001EE55BCA|nr:multiple epidermal growth factor-like domains protein 10 isoform X1 [Haliotis rubra]
MASTDAPCMLHLLLICFLQACLSQHASALWECHCTSGCDVGFRCASGCFKGWSGPTCQIRNIALNKPTEQSGTVNDCKWAYTAARRDVCGNKTSSLAVDGDVNSNYWSGTCTHTEPHMTPAWWTVDLGQTHLITNLRIFFSNPQRMQGFLVGVDHKRVCYEWSRTHRPSSPVNISCDTPTRGQHVTVQLPTLVGSGYILNLCEVEIYECTDGSFGPDCGTWCYCRNTSEVCDKITGYCESGCKDGYTGTGCQEPCPHGRYGSGCMETCGHCAGGDQNCHNVDGTCSHGCQEYWSGKLCKECSDNWFGDQCGRECRCKNRQEVCDKRTGQCHSGCEDGWTGLDCQTPCQDGTYGFNCTGRCGRCQDGQPCDKIGGECQTCADGFKPPFCQVCDDYFYGEQCSSMCGHCRDNAICNNVSGDCPDGCEPGWQRMTCHQACPEGGYGSDCMETCGHCAGGDQNCSNVDGICRHGCQDNWSGTLCKECSDYWFGDQCDRECRCKDAYEVCDKRTGQCDSGCEDGWTGLDCQTPCQDGTYGFNCTGRCGRCQGGQPCAKIGGECQTCAPGFKIPFCQECDDYFYGEQCSSRCGHCRDNAICNNVSGDCPDGCEPGWQRMTCHQECDEGRYGDGCSEACGQCAGKCSPVNGSCDQEGCRDGWTGQRCDDACPNGTFGPACSHQCGQCLGGHVCDKGTGECPGSWCERGWKGLQCLTDCNGTGFYGYNCNETCGMCVEEVCDPITGECPRGCRPKYVGATCNLQQPSNSGGHAGAGVAYAFAVVVVVSMIVAMYFLKRRKQRKSNTDVAAASPDVVVNQAYPGEGAVSDEGDADGIYVNVELTKVKVAELREYIAKREDKFVSEYGRVPRGLLHPHTAATTPEHRPKNRFKAMYPYDHSRVVLQKTPRDKHSDYINANYINTYKEKKAFIATQGPMPKTVGDFWRMIWQEETDIIVMLTRLKEGIKVKCEKYWPEEKSPLKLGDLTITNDGVTERPDYCITQITIQHKKLNERRQVMHLHYVTWPDHGVPSSPPLVRFWKVFRSMAADSKAPVVVHCSAGVGRTGTFIALEALMERARREGVVDVHEFVLKMRADRVSMVQTKEQYLFLHQVVLEALYSDMTHMTPTMFDSRFCTDNLASASEEAILKKNGRNSLN